MTGSPHTFHLLATTPRDPVVLQRPVPSFQTSLREGLSFLI